MKYLAAVLLWVALAIPAMAQVEYDQATSSLKIYGGTTSYQAAEVQKVLSENDVDVIYMWGPGGEFYAGLRIGRMIAESGAWVVVPRGQECASACALAAVAAANIITNGNLMFHRPFFRGIPTNETIDDVAEHYGRVYLDMAEYLLRMGFDVKFTREIIMRSSPCKFVVIDASGVASARKTGDFPVHKIDNRCMARG